MKQLDLSTAGKLTSLNGSFLSCDLLAIMYYVRSIGGKLLGVTT